MSATWTDSHCHLGYDGVGEEAVVAAAEAGVTRLITVGTDRDRSLAAVEVARRHPGVYATVGLHPHEAVQGVGSVEPMLRASLPEVVGVGECGLDYYYEHSPRSVQRDAFAAQVALASELDLTLVVHTRDAWDDTFEVLASQGTPDRWVVHCFSGGRAEAERAVDMGAYISFSGIVTFKNAPEVREAARACPAERILVETDSPFLAPVPHRGRPNQPALVAVVGAAVAALRGVAVDELASMTTRNATAAFRLPA